MSLVSGLGSLDVISVWVRLVSLDVISVWVRLGLGFWMSLVSGLG